LKLLEENIEEIFEDIGIGNDFLNRTLIAQEIRGIIDKLDCRKSKICTANETITKVKR
jgi:hypothetical protein